MFETLESRQMRSVTVSGYPDGFVQVNGDSQDNVIIIEQSGNDLVIKASIPNGKPAVIFQAPKSQCHGMVIVYGSDGNDYIRNDTSIVLDAQGNGGNDSVYGGAEGDYLSGGEGNDYVYGRGGDDWDVNGDNGNDVLSGGDSNDYINGGAGSDVMYGNNGDDTIYAKDGIAGNDIVDCGTGYDKATVDLFVYPKLDGTIGVVYDDFISVEVLST